MNGIDEYTNGLPPAYQPSFLLATYDSGEALYFRTDNNPEADWSREILYCQSPDDTQLGAKGGQIL